jgi:hypothetical protein
MFLAHRLLITDKCLPWAKRLLDWTCILMHFILKNHTASDPAQVEDAALHVPRYPDI